MTESAPTPSDTDIETDEDDEIEVELPEYPLGVELAEQRRAYIFTQLAPLEYTIADKIAEAQAWCEWITQGTVPAGETGRKNRLREVK